MLKAPWGGEGRGTGLLLGWGGLGTPCPRLLGRLPILGLTLYFLISEYLSWAELLIWETTY